MPEDKAWFEEWFDSPYYSLLYQNRDEEEAHYFLDNLLQFLHPQKGSEFLDLACGSGRHAVYLAAKGFLVTGIDLSKNQIEKARKSETDNLSFYVHDMRNEFRINYFDCIFNLFTSFGYFNSEHDNERVLHNVNKGLKEGGVFVLDYFNIQKVESTLVEQEDQKVNGTLFNIHRSIDEGFVTKHIDIDDQGKSFHFEERVKALSKKDLENYLSKTGFRIQNVFGSYSLEDFDMENSDRLIFIAEKTHA